MPLECAVCTEQFSGEEVSAQTFPSSVYFLVFGHGMSAGQSFRCIYLMVLGSVLVPTGVFLIAVIMKGSGVGMTQSFPAAPVGEGMKEQGAEDPG